MEKLVSTSLAEVVQYLRKRVVDVREAKDELGLADMVTTLDILRDGAWGAKDEALAIILQDLLDASQDALSGVDWKSVVPAEADIRAAFA